PPSSYATAGAMLAGADAILFVAVGAATAGGSGVISVGADSVDGLVRKRGARKANGQRDPDCDCLAGGTSGAEPEDDLTRCVVPEIGVTSNGGRSSRALTGSDSQPDGLGSAAIGDTVSCALPLTPRATALAVVRAAGGLGGTWVSSPIGSGSRSKSITTKDRGLAVISTAATS